jgi:histidine triad (HIT) family protein
MENQHCTFCDLIHGSAEVSICHEDADAIAFMDIQPVNNGHVLVVPREHYESLLDVPPEIGAHLFQITMRLANAVRNVSGCDDMNIVVNSGKAAGQDEPHYHVHIIPRREGDGFDIPLPFNGSEMPDRTLLDAYAARIGSALRDPARVEHSGGAAGSNASGRSEPKTVVPRKTEARRAMATEAALGTVERAVAVPTFAESGKQEEQRPEREWRVQEGAHGELLYEPVADRGDGAM